MRDGRIGDSSRIDAAVKLSRQKSVA